MPECKKTDPLNERVFSGHFPTGISYADRAVEVRGDYKKLAHLYYEGLRLTIEGDCPKDLADYIARDAAEVIARGRFMLDNATESRNSWEWSIGCDSIDNRHPYKPQS